MSFSIFDERNFLGIIILLLSQEVVCHIHPFLQATMFSLSPFPEIQNQKISAVGNYYAIDCLHLTSSWRHVQARI
jgi:hypothetical protein